MHTEQRAACLAAIERIATISRLCGLIPARSVSWVRACEEIGRLVRRDSEDTAGRQRHRIRELMLSTSRDPLLLTWEPLGALEKEKDEPVWTQWLRGLFSDKSAGMHAWQAFCEVVASVPPHDPGAYADRGRPLATSSDWIRAANCSPAVVAEDLTGDGGLVDLRIKTEGLSVVVENKLWEGWHDRPKKAQHLTCSDWARENARTGDRVGLIFLSVYKATEERRPGWVFVTWRDVAQAFRRTLIRADLAEPRGAERPALAPIAYSVASIEKHLLAFRPETLSDGVRSRFAIRDVMRVADILRYLEECRDR
jgi:hypothetical protein